MLHDHCAGQIGMDFIQSGRVLFEVLSWSSLEGLRKSM
jgi:hypothetical protein